MTANRAMCIRVELQKHHNDNIRGEGHRNLRKCRRKVGTPHQSHLQGGQRQISFPAMDGPVWKIACSQPTGAACIIIAMKTTPFTVFCGYYLGLNKNFEAAWFNIHTLAKHLEMSPENLRALMDDHFMIPERVRHIDYNIAKAHATAQELAMDGRRDDVITFAKHTFMEFRQAMGSYDESRDFEDINYDEIFPEEKNGNVL